MVVSTADMKTHKFSLLVPSLFRLFNRKFSVILMFMLILAPAALWNLAVLPLLPEEKGVFRAIAFLLLGGIFFVVYCVWAFLVVFWWNKAFPPSEDHITFLKK